MDARLGVEVACDSDGVVEWWAAVMVGLGRRGSYGGGAAEPGLWGGCFGEEEDAAVGRSIGGDSLRIKGARKAKPDSTSAGLRKD